MINYQEKKNERENVWNAWIFSTNVNKRPKALCCPEATKKAMLTKKNILVPFSSLKLSATFSRPDSDGGSFRYERHFYDSLSHKVTQTKLLLGKKGGTTMKSWWIHVLIHARFRLLFGKSRERRQLRPASLSRSASSAPLPPLRSDLD